MNKKILLAAGVIAAVTSSAFAAGVDINGASASLADVATGSVSVDACTSALLLDVVPGGHDATTGDWLAGGLDITAAPPATDLDACIGFEVSGVVTAEDADGTPFTIDTDVVVVTAGTTSLRLTPVQPIGLNGVVRADVLVDEPNLEAAAPAAPASKDISAISASAEWPGVTANQGSYGWAYAQNTTPQYGTLGLGNFDLTCPAGTEGVTRWVQGSAPGTNVMIRANSDGATNHADEVVILLGDGTRVASGAADATYANPGQHLLVGGLWCEAGGTMAGSTTADQIGWHWS